MMFTKNMKMQDKKLSFIQELLNLNYDQCCQRLIEKYGPVPGNYFCRDNYKSINPKIKRTKEGLFIHHMDEDKAIMLSEPKHILPWNKLFPETPYLWEWQKADRLNYCNLLEHLVLHIKIIQHPSPQKLPRQNVGLGGVYNFMVPQLNDIYGGIKHKQPYLIKVTDTVLPLYNDYLLCINEIFKNKLVDLNKILKSMNQSVRFTTIKWGWQRKF